MAFLALCWRPQFIVRATVLGENLTHDHQRAAPRALCVCRLASARRISQPSQEFPIAGPHLMCGDRGPQAHGCALNFFAYNFIKFHRTLRMSPAIAAGVTDRLLSVEDLVTLWEAYEQRRAERQVA